MPVRHTLHGLAADLSGAAAQAASEMPLIVDENAKYGRDLAKALAKVAAGPHGKNFYKRITSETTGPLEAEFGPNAGGTPVGAGYRHGSGNSDLEKAAGPAGKAMADDVRSMVRRIL